ncbi:MAG: site-specific DNA-methyltransferase, partial [Dehalococcoidales bacterium]|nr:site-specific DNA-methyltransferase [Dehalococcoidales bacterium]
MAKQKQVNNKDIDAIRHKDKRSNIPTSELRDFAKQDEDTPKRILYPRDPSLDPQLVWKGKDEQDSKDLEVPAVPVYIQEKIHPKFIIEDLRAQAKEGKPEQLDFFADFNGLNFEEVVEFYQHEQQWTNRMILGDSLLVMTSLAEKEGLKGKVQTIYMDPPYGIKFGSNWQTSTRKRDVKDGSVTDATRQPEQIKAFRDTWELGIHSYLAYLRDRLVVARDLLTETGSCFLQIGDENVHLVRCLMDEVFGSENIISIIFYKKTTGAGSSGDLLAPPSVGDYILWYAKQKYNVKYRSLFSEKCLGGEGTSGYKKVELRNKERLSIAEWERQFNTTLDINNIPDGIEIYTLDNLTSQSGGESGRFPIVLNNKEFRIKRGSWKTNEDGIRKLIISGRLDTTEQNGIGYVRYLNDFPVMPVTNLWTDTVGQNQFSGEKIYVVQTATKVVDRCLQMTTDPGDLVLDPTCGSGTTAYAAEHLGRRWITIDTSRVALALARTRLMAAKFPYYLLADSPEGIKKETEITGLIPPDYRTDGDIKKGFVYKRIPHITLKSIANNPDIKEGMSQKEIDEAIARHADTEILYDQPYEDNKRIRVTGPFTVESLSPHRVIVTEEERPNAEIEAQREAGTGQFETVVLENLKKAGVQNTVKHERLKFTRLDHYPSEWLHAEGEYIEQDGAIKRVAVCIGPEHGTVGPELVKEAAKEAVRGIGFDLLLICGFAFDPHVREEAKRYGKLNVLIVNMSPEFLMSDELLKKTGAGNLFMVFGEPDVDIKHHNGKVTIEIKGVDVYDPTTGHVRSNSTDDIACWFI